MKLKNNSKKLKVKTGNYTIKEIDYVIKPFHFKKELILNSKLSKITRNIKNYIEYKIPEKTTNAPLPYGYKYTNNKPRFSIIFLMSSFKTFKKVHSDILNHNIIYTMSDCEEYVNDNE